MSYSLYANQNDTLISSLLAFYKVDIDGVYNPDNHLDKMFKIISGASNISLRIVDWFVTNYAKKNFTLYTFLDASGQPKRFKVYNHYKLSLKSYSKYRFDPFCRQTRISIDYKDGTCIETTIAQLNFFKWAFENKVIDYVEQHYDAIQKDMNNCNSTSKKKYKKLQANELVTPNANASAATASAATASANPSVNPLTTDLESSLSNLSLTTDVSTRRTAGANSHSKTRKKREELSISATKSIKKENVEIVVRFG